MTPVILQDDTARAFKAATVILNQAWREVWEERARDLCEALDLLGDLRRDIADALDLDAPALYDLCVELTHFTSMKED